MQESFFPDGRLTRHIVTADTDTEMQAKLKALHAEALAAGATDIRQAVMEPNQKCPCGSGRKTKNCCLRRYRSFLARRGDK